MTTALAIHSDAHAARNRLAIGVLLVSTFIVFLNETILSVALPTLIRDFHTTAATAQWLNTGFLLTAAVVIPITGFLLQRFSTRSLFIVAMSLFSLGTLLASTAPTFDVLLIARVIQAGGTAIIMPLLMTVAVTLVAPSSRGRVMGNIAIVISVAPAIGPTIAGLILSSLSWRFMFILVLPIAVAALVVGCIRVPNVSEPERVPLDVTSVILSAFAFGGLLYGLSSIGQAATGAQPPVSPLVSISVGIVGLVCFILRQVRLASRPAGVPLLDLRTFRSRTFSLSIVMYASNSVAVFGSIIILPIYLQTVLGLSTLSTGLLLLPGSLVMGLLAPLVGRLYDRIGPTVLLVIGSTLVSASMWCMALLFVGPGDSAAVVPFVYIVLGLGQGFTITPLFSASLGAVRTELYSHASAILNTVQQVAAGIGTALFVTLFSTAVAVELTRGAAERSATASGVHSAFLVGGMISLVTVAASWLVRQPRLDDSSTADRAG